jgi:HPr kinase/phosphorylase
MHQPGEQPEIRKTEQPHPRLHGGLVRVFGVGMLLTGESGIGKSECALDLITRGHLLVADDVVDVELSSDGPVGYAPDVTYGLLEIRGLGIIDVRRAFGDAWVCKRSSVDLCVEFRKDVEGERLGNFVERTEILGSPIPKLVIPVTPGRNLAILVETAARVFLQRDTGAAAGDALLAATSTLYSA